MKKTILRSLALLLTLSLLAGLCCIGAAAYDYSYPNTYTNTGDQAADIVAVAQTQLGYREDPDDHSKYNEWYYGYDNKLAWCSIFISWCAEQAGIPTTTIRRTNAARGWDTSNMESNPYGAPAIAFGAVTPKPGDILFTITQTGATTSTHTALVCEVDSKTIYTIEGNTSIGGVGVVGNRKYRLDTGYQYYSNYNNPSGTTHILFIVRPEYHNHVYQYDHEIAPTCQEPGYTVYSCKGCGDSYQEATGSTVGHSFTSYSYNGDAQICMDGTETAACDYGCGATDTHTSAGTALPDPNPNNPFIDVAPGQYYYNPVLWAVANKITSGTSDTTFSPGGDCTRAQVVAFLWRAAGRPEPTTTENPFADVAPGQYYYKAVLWAVENKITSGTSNTTFSPDATCTRAQVVAFLWRAAGRPEPTSDSCSFEDVEAGQYYYKAVLWAVENKITSGTSNTAFSPSGTCTRAQVVSFLWRNAGRP